LQRDHQLDWAFC
jgi:hypothetical protein